MRIIAYTYEADFHCPSCAEKRFGHGEKAGRAALNLPLAAVEFDEHWIPLRQEDDEGNEVRPVFSTDELPCDLPAEAGGYSPVVCGDCHAVIKERASHAQPN